MQQAFADMTINSSRTASCWNPLDRCVAGQYVQPEDYAIIIIIIIIIIMQLCWQK